MKAAVLHKGEKFLRFEDVPRPVVLPGTVRVKVKACGVCGSDVHLVIHGNMPPNGYPRIPGHESSGVILETGEGVSRVQAGDSVVISAGTSCGQCPACKAGRENLCPDVGVLGFAADGAYAEEVVVPERCVNPLPAGIPFPQAAILADAVSTPYHALRFAGGLKPGMRAAVFGCGGLGIHGVLLARVLGAEVFALDVDNGALDNAKRAGAHECIDLKGRVNPGKVLRERGGVDLVVDFSGHYKNIEDCIRAMNPGGRMVMVGLGRDSMKIAMPAALIFKQISLCGSYGADSRSLPELIDLVQSGKLNLDSSITAVHPLSHAQQCLEDLDARRGNPIRFVLNPEL